MLAHATDGCGSPSPPIGYNLGMPVAERLRIPIWREGRVALERASLMRDPVLRGVGIERGDGAPVLMIPGFMAGDLSLTLMARWLRDMGYRPCRAGIRANVDCTERALGRLEEQLEGFAERHGRRVRIVGHSRGGTMARILAVRRPDLVEGIVCLGAPLADQLKVHPLVRAQVRTVALLGSLGVPGLFSYGCGSGCCAAGHRRHDRAVSGWGGVHLGLFAQRRSRRLAGVSGPRRDRSRGALEPRRHGGQPGGIPGSGGCAGQQRDTWASGASRSRPRPSRQTQPLRRK